MARFSEFLRYVYWAEHLYPELPHPNLPTKAGGRDNPSLPTDQELIISPALSYSCIRYHLRSSRGEKVGLKLNIQKTKITA